MVTGGPARVWRSSWQMAKNENQASSVLSVVSFERRQQGLVLDTSRVLRFDSAPRVVEGGELVVPSSSWSIESDSSMKGWGGHVVGRNLIAQGVGSGGDQETHQCVRDESSPTRSESVSEICGRKMCGCQSR